MFASSRILIAELDSPAQAERFAAQGARAAITDLTGMLRVGLLVSRTILVTDAMLLDGEYFMALGPEGVLRELGATQARYPLTITGRHPTLRDGLQARLEIADFRWSLAAAQGNLSDGLHRSWAEWLRFVENGIIRYEQQENANAPLRTGPLPAASESSFAALASSGLGDERIRSNAWGIIDGLDVEEDYRSSVRLWWNDAYLRMIAENANADWVGFEIAESKLGREQNDLPLPENLVRWARSSSPATIALAWDATEKERERLHARPSWSRVRALAFGATQIATVPSRRGVLLGSWAKLGIAIVVLALAAPWLEIDSIESPWAWVAFAGAIATTVPFDALGALIGLMKPASRARLMIFRGDGA